MNYDTIGDRMKAYEAIATSDRLLPLVPAVIRLDGRGFHKFTKGLVRPYDTRLTEAFVAVTSKLVEETNAVMGYCQSDEISLCLYEEHIDQQLYFDGKVFKITSALAALASVLFYREVVNRLPPGYADRLPTFDCRVSNMPTKVEATNYFMWREWDATKNSITMAASTEYTQQELEGKNGSQKQEMLFKRGINWNEFPTSFKRGTYVQRRTVSKPFTMAEREALPLGHHARKNPDLLVERRAIITLDMPPLAKVVNRVEVVFNAEAPAVAEAPDLLSCVS